MRGARDHVKTPGPYATQRWFMNRGGVHHAQKTGTVPLLVVTEGDVESVMFALARYTRVPGVVDITLLVPGRNDISGAKSTHKGKRMT